jgi:hypothetical protein
MTLTELINEVYTITNRPDRIAETASAIKSATLKAHHSDFFWKDIFEAGIAFSTSDYIQSFMYREVVPLWRATKYLRVWDNVNQTAGRFIDLILPEQVLDRYLVEKTNIYYAAGAEITIKVDTQQQYFLMGCYVHPDVTTTGYNSWIALDQPYAIVFDAAATVFKAIGKDEEAAAFRTLVPEQLQLLKQSNILASGY